MNTKRLAKFKARIGEALAAGVSDFHRKAVQEVALETGADLLSVAAAIASLVEGGRARAVRGAVAQLCAAARDFGHEARDESAGSRKPRREKPPAADLPSMPEGGYTFEDDGKQITWRLEVGQRHGATPGNIVGAIANEAQSCRASRSTASTCAPPIRWCGCRPCCRGP